MIKDYPVAKASEYGYREYSILKKAWKYFMNFFFVFIIILLYLPLGVIALQSVNNTSDLSVFNKFDFSAYTGMFADRMFSNSVQNTVLVTLISTLISTVLGTFFAVGIHSLDVKRRRRIILLNNIPLLNADIVTGISLMLVFSLFLPLFPYLFGLTTLILAHVFFTLPYVVLSVLPKLKELDPNLLDAATDLGVKPFRALIKVVFPAIKSGIFSGMLLAFTMSIDDFVVSYFTTGNGYDNLSIWIYGSIGRKSLNPAVYAFSTSLTITTLTVLLVINFFNYRKAKKDV
ncbi:MAG: ABC transporter permease [Bacilli bacterium]|nr:ABC transporter permease [Bacilli bacterium]